MTLTLAWSLLHLLWQGAVVAGIVAALLAAVPSRRAAARHVVAVAGLAAMLLLVPATFASLTRIRRATPSDLPARTARIAAIEPTTGTSMQVQRAALRTAALSRWIVIGWMAGASLMALRLTGGFYLQRRGRRWSHARPAPVHWVTTMRRLAEAFGIRNEIPVRLSEGVSVPTLAGVARPMILLPATVADRLTSAEARSLLAHELAHVARRDPWTTLLARTAEAVLFFHPAVHWLGRVLDRERERATDDLVLRHRTDRLTYARTLTRLEELRGHQPPGAVAPFALAAVGGNLLERIRRITIGVPEAPRGRRAVRVACTTCLSAGIAFGAVAGVYPASIAVLTGQAMVIRAEDPAGKFELTILDGRLIGATFGSPPEALPARGWTQRGNQVVFTDPARAGRLAVTVAPDGIHWTPRIPSPATSE